MDGSTSWAEYGQAGCDLYLFDHNLHYLSIRAPPTRPTRLAGFLYGLWDHCSHPYLCNAIFERTIVSARFSIAGKLDRLPSCTPNPSEVIKSAPKYFVFTVSVLIGSTRGRQYLRSARSAKISAPCKQLRDESLPILYAKVTMV